MSNNLPFPEVNYSSDKIITQEEIDAIMEKHVQQELQRHLDDFNTIAPYKDQIDLIYSQTNFIDVALDRMAKAGIPKLVRHTWYFKMVKEKSVHIVK